MKVIIDKSWLIDIKTKELIDFAKENELILIAPLGYELFTSVNRMYVKSVWNKLANVRKAVKLLEGVSYFLKYEVEKKERICNYSPHYLYEFNPSIELIEDNIILNKSQQEVIDKSKNYWEIDGLISFKEICSGVYNYIPEMLNVGKNSTRESIQHILLKISDDEEFVKNVYDDIKPNEYPSAELINKNWAIFRWVQIILLYGVEYIRKYGVNNTSIISSKFATANSNIDREYLLIGSLFNSLATNDKDILYFFKLLCPDGILFTNINNVKNKIISKQYGK